MKKTIPYLVTCDDYHSFTEMNDYLPPGFKCIEIDIEKYGYEFRGNYIGVVFKQGKKPNKAKIKELVLNEYGRPQIT